jgi:hypothetical protein
MAQSICEPGTAHSSRAVGVMSWTTSIPGCTDQASRSPVVRAASRSICMTSMVMGARRRKRTPPTVPRNSSRPAASVATPWRHRGPSPGWWPSTSRNPTSALCRAASLRDRAQSTLLTFAREPGASAFRHQCGDQRRPTAMDLGAWRKSPGCAHSGPLRGQSTGRSEGGFRDTCSAGGAYSGSVRVGASRRLTGFVGHASHLGRHEESHADRRPPGPHDGRSHPYEDEGSDQPPADWTTPRRSLHGDEG